MPTGFKLVGASRDFSRPDGPVEFNEAVEFGLVLLFPVGELALEATSRAMPQGESLEFSGEPVNIESRAVGSAFELGSLASVECAADWAEFLEPSLRLVLAPHGVLERVPGRFDALLQTTKVAGAVGGPVAQLGVEPVAFGPQGFDGNQVAWAAVDGELL